MELTCNLFNNKMEKRFGVKSELVKKIKSDLKIAMQEEVKFRKAAEQGLTGFSKNRYDSIIAQKEVSRAIISMFPEIGTKPDKATDEETVKLLKKYISMEKTRELYQQKHLTETDVKNLNSAQLNALVISKFHELGDKLTSTKIELARGYLPKQASREEVKKWIIENIDFSIYKNKMQAMGPIMKHFQGCDGNFVKKILTEVI